MIMHFIFSWVPTLYSSEKEIQSCWDTRFGMHMYWQPQIRSYITLSFKSHVGDLASLPAYRRTHTQTEEKALSLIYSIIRGQYFQWPQARRVCMPLCRLNGTAHDWEYLMQLAMCQKWVGSTLACMNRRFFYVEAIILNLKGRTFLLCILA